MIENPQDNEHVYEQWLRDRQRGRTDLFWLCTNVLHYEDLEREVHQPIIDNLQQFPGGTDTLSTKDGALIDYKPHTELWYLTGPRNRLILYPRGTLKTTIATIAHVIQWIINYPDIRMLISTSTAERHIETINEIIAHFKSNEHFRFLYPEVCPDKRLKNWGSQDGFTVPNRKRKWMKEKTVSACSVGKSIAGPHYEVIKHSDLVDKENVKTANAIMEVRRHYGYTNPLLERGPVNEVWPKGNPGWIDVEGTPYDFGDLHMRLFEQEQRATPDKKKFSVLLKSAINDDGTPLWPTRLPLEELESIKDDPEIGLYMFSCQYLCKPIPPSGGLAKSEEIVFIPRDVIRKIMLRKHVTVDLAGMEQFTTGYHDFTVLNVAGFDQDGRCHILELRRGRFTPEQVIYHIFDIHKKYRPLDFKIEKDAHARVLLPFLAREMSKRGEFPNVIGIPRDTRVSKKQRIMGLQPWFATGNIKFVEDIDHKIELLQEITRFSPNSTYHDDILDTTADHMQNRDGGVIYDVYPDTQKGDDLERSFPGQKKFVGFDPIDPRRMLFTGDVPGGDPHVDPKTGL